MRPLEAFAATVILAVLRSRLSVTALRSFLPLSRTFTLPLTATVAETIFVPAGALSLNLSLPPRTHFVADGRPSTVAMSTGTGVGVGGGVIFGLVGVGVGLTGVGVAVGVGVDTPAAPACHWNPRLSPAPWYRLSPAPRSGSVAANR